MSPLAANDDFVFADLQADQLREIAQAMSVRFAQGDPESAVFGAAVQTLARQTAETLSDIYRSPRKEHTHG